MKLYDISQLPVLDKNGEVVGIVDESDIQMKVFHDDTRFKDAVASAMTSRLETGHAPPPLAAVLPSYARPQVAIVYPRRSLLRRIKHTAFRTHLPRQNTYKHY